MYSTFTINIITIITFGVLLLLTVNQVDAFNTPKDPKLVRRDVIKSFTNAAFGIVATTTASVMTPINHNNNNDIAWASFIPTTTVQHDTTSNFVIPLTMDGTTISSTEKCFERLTTLLVSQDDAEPPILTARQTISTNRDTVQGTWFTYIDNNNYSALLSSHNVINPSTRTAANTIVTQNPNKPLLATYRNNMFTALDQIKIAAQNSNQNTCRLQTNVLLNNKNSFIDLAPPP